MRLTIAGLEPAVVSHPRYSRLLIDPRISLDRIKIGEDAGTMVISFNGNQCTSIFAAKRRCHTRKLQRAKPLL